MSNSGDQFITYFPNSKFRYLDLTGNGRPPVSSDVKRKDLNEQGYCAFFTVNGFSGANATKENCVNLTSFFIDVDYKLTPEEIEKIKAILDPTFIVETFNGFHFYWLLDEVIEKSDLTEEEWKVSMTRWERIEQSIVDTIPKTDKSVKDVPRILRLPGSFYWKKTGEKYKAGTDGAFKVIGIYKNISANYTMDEVEEAFPVKEVAVTFNDINSSINSKAKKYSEVERNSFFKKINDAYPIEQRDSFKLLISADPSTIPPNFGRNNALMVTVSLMNQAGWTKEKVIEHIKLHGWHGMEREQGGWGEILHVIKGSFDVNYSYSYKNEVIAYNMSPEESLAIEEVYTKTMKERKEKDKIRFSNYEREILAKYPYLRKNEIGIIFRYEGGVYKTMSDQEVSDLVLNCLFEDMLWGYRTKRNVSDKVACLISIIPNLNITDDGGYIANVRNGLLNIYTKELMPHTPTFVSLIQYPVDYDPTAKAPVWEQCIQDWMKGDEQEDKIRLIKQFSGYCLSSSMLHDKALFMVGDGGNGKSTFIDTIAMIFGPMATSHIDLESLYSDFGMHGLVGKRLNVIEEVHGNYYQSNKLKKLISGEEVTINIKYKPQFTFRPQAKFVFSVNLLPRVDDISNGTERRILAVSFLNNYRDNPNYQLRSRVGLLAQELSGILNWMIDGAIDLADNKKFITTREQIRMLNEYREENSSVEGFISQCIELSEGSTIDSPHLYSEYRKWSTTDGGRKTKSNITFTKEMKMYGVRAGVKYVARTSGSNEAYFEGVRFRPQWLAQSNGPFSQVIPHLDF